MPLNNDESEAVRNFLKVFGANSKIDNEAVGMALFGQKHMLDVNSSREYVDRFFQKCEKRDPSASKTLTRRANSLMNSSDTLIYAMEFIVRCRQSHLFYHKSSQQFVENPSGITRTSSNMGGSAQSSPFQRRSASRTRVFSNLTAENQLLNESTRSRANTSFNSFDNRHLGMERSSQISRPKSPFRIVNSSDVKTPTSASNHLFSSQFRTPQSQEPSPYRTSSNFTNGSSSSSVNPVRVGNSTSNIPLHARMGGAICETESTVCECLLAALLGIDSRLFRSDGARKMTICSTASLTTTHVGIAYRFLETANIYQHLSHRDPLLYSSSSSSAPSNEPISIALLAGIRHLLGEYTADIDGLRRNRKKLRFSGILPIIDLWNVRLILMMKCFSLRKLEQIDILEAIFIIHCRYSFEPNRLFVAEKLIEYTMGVFCQQMIEWMKTGEIPTEKWVIYKENTENVMKIRKVPIFLTNSDMKMLLEIGKSLSKIDSSSDEDLLAIEQATNCVTRQLNWKIIQKRELSGLLRILRDVVCGIVMRTVMSTGRLKDHLNMATSIFFLNNPKFTATLYSVMKEASMGLRVGTTSLSRQKVSIALAAAIESSTRIMFEEEKDRKKKKLQFKLDAMTSLGNTPNVSSRMQFIQPLCPKYEPVMNLVKPVFSACDDFYEAIFHVIWSIDLARLSSQETASKLPEMCRFLEKNYSLRENARSLLRMLGNIAFIINSTLLKVRNVIGIKVHLEFRRLLAAIDEKCVDVDDLIEEHLKFVKKVANLVFLEENDKIEPQLSVFLQTTFEAQKMIDEFCSIWDQIIDENFEDQNVLKAKMAEISKNWVVKIRVLMDKINTIQKKMIEDLDHQIMYGKE
ncbi:unnamed protein product [Caenorhabditis angaria]|uniref:Gamma-tubulin complex component n=1 Tax=Caenorhabditis angaria TaxID=860376 RepID=A0A9P1IJ45_9PELO|nr:unnamed protein product [Caenorhabditis angaria]